MPTLPIARPLADAVQVMKGPFGRPYVRHLNRPQPAWEGSQLDADIARLRLINEARMELRGTAAQNMDYFILVPTLRCNLSCDYCQVSRAAESARGFDWDADTLSSTIDFIAERAGLTPTLEFQGGEPLLRLDAIIEVRDALIRLGKRPRVVVCTNLQSVSAEAWAFLAQPNVLVSSSFDGTWQDHDRHRTNGTSNLEQFRDNLLRALATLGRDRVSLTSTIDPKAPPRPADVFSTMRNLGVTTMFMRPVNYQGFARKAYRDVRQDDAWDHYYRAFLDALIADNLDHSTALSEYYFSYILRRILDPRHSEYVDLRNPNILGRDYVVIGEKGDLFPSDEARMLYRSGQIDLRIGHVSHGIDEAVVTQLNTCSDNRLDPDCARCVYQAVCGRDLIDDISRYGRIDTPRSETRHCRRHLSIFDYVMHKLAFSPAAEIEVMARMAGLDSIDVRAYR